MLFTAGYARNAIVHHGRLDHGGQPPTEPFFVDELASKCATFWRPYSKRAPETGDQGDAAQAVARDRPQLAGKRPFAEPPERQTSR